MYTRYEQSDGVQGQIIHGTMLAHKICSNIRGYKLEVSPNIQKLKELHLLSQFKIPEFGYVQSCLAYITHTCGGTGKY